MSEIKQGIKRGPSFQDWGVRAIRNTAPDLWPPYAVDDDQPAKWQTRRAINVPPGIMPIEAMSTDRGVGLLVEKATGSPWIGAYATYQPGAYYICEGVKRDGEAMVYTADGEYVRDQNGDIVEWRKANGDPYKVDKLPAMYMPRRAARTYVDIMVEVEELHEITEPDVLAEGVCVGWVGADLRYWPPYAPDAQYMTAQRAFRHIWNDINGDGDWERNPLVWVYCMKRIPSAGEDTPQQVYSLPDSMGGGWGARAGCEVSDGFTSPEQAREWVKRKTRALERERHQMMAECKEENDG